MTETEPPHSPDLPRSAETIAVLDFDVPDVPDDPSELEPGTPTQPVRKTTSAPQPPRPARQPKQLAVRIAFLTALLLCLGWGVMQVRDLFNVKRQGPRITNTHAGAAAVAPGPPPDPADALDPSLYEDPDDTTYPGLRASTLLRTHVRQVDLERDDGDGTIVALGDDAIALQAVTVVNLWATWCGPCKAEFSDFQDMFILNQRDRGWGSETRFVPILVDDPENARSAYRTWKTSMPPIHAALIDLKLDQGGVRNALAQIDRLAPKESLPITLLVDCRRKIRWSKMSALDADSFVILANEIDKLRAELRQDKCRIKRPVQPSAPPLLDHTADDATPPEPTPARTGKPCNARRLCTEGENCNNRCCRCPDGVRCNVRSTGIGVCPGKLDD